jgi:hypothetical protein
LENNPISSIFCSRLYAGGRPLRPGSLESIEAA